LLTWTKSYRVAITKPNWSEDAPSRTLQRKSCAGVISGNAPEVWSRLVASDGRLPDRLAFVARPVHIKCLLLFGFFSFFARPHEAHCLLDGGGALVFERAPLAASDKFVPVLNHQRNGREVLQEGVPGDNGQDPSRPVKIRPFSARAVPKKMSCNSGFHVQGMADVEEPPFEFKGVDVALRHMRALLLLASCCSRTATRQCD
jgi:hypothetical protein